MFNFILGFMSGIYLGTYHTTTCKPILERLSDCVKKEFHTKLNDMESRNKDSNSESKKD